VHDPIAELEEGLVLQAQQGDRGAFGELVSRYYDGVIKTVYHLCGDDQMAQDAAQEAFLRAWVKLPAFRPQAPFRNWVYRIAVNAALDTLRKKPMESLEESENRPGMTGEDHSPEAAYIEKERADMIQCAVQALPEAARTVLVLREYGDLSYEAIASVLEIPMGTVMSRLSYARSRLRESLQEYRLETEREYA
jgi:RNA polymerase sigma-70 factor (ECF subfamily)